MDRAAIVACPIMVVGVVNWHFRSTPESEHEAQVERNAWSKAYAYLGRERLHSAVPDRLGSTRGGEKFDQSFRTFNLS